MGIKTPFQHPGTGTVEVKHVQKFGIGELDSQGQKEQEQRLSRAEGDFHPVHYAQYPQKSLEVFNMWETEAQASKSCFLEMLKIS